MPYSYPLTKPKTDVMTANIAPGRRVGRIAEAIIEGDGNEATSCRDQEPEACDGKLVLAQVVRKWWWTISPLLSCRR